MSRAVWKLLPTYLPRRGRRLFAVALLSAAGGALEAVVLVLTVRAAVAIADGADKVVFSPPVLGTQSVGIPELLLWASGAALLSAATGLIVAAMMARVSSDMLEHARAATLRAFSRASWNYQAASREGAIQETVSNNAMQASELGVALTRGLSNAM